MKRIVLVVLILVCSRQLSAGMRQRADSHEGGLSEAASLTSDHALPPAEFGKPGSVTSADSATDAAPDADPDSDPAAGQTPQGSPRAKKPKLPPRPVEESQMPTIQNIKIGYLDSAIIGSQIRVRFDAAFDSRFPDRAEFFYAKCGCFADLPPGATQADGNAPGPGPGDANRINFQQLYLLAEYAGNDRFSVFAEVPVRVVHYLSYGNFPAPSGQSTFVRQAGLSDVNAGFKLALLANPVRYLTVQMEGIFPTGNASLGLGTNHFSVVPALLYYQRLTNYWSIDSEISDTHPIGGSGGVAGAGKGGFAGDVLFYGIGPSYELITTEKFHLSPVLELVGWSVLGGDETTTNTGVSAKGINIFNLKWGARMSFGAHSSAYVGFGQALTTATWYRDIVRVEYRYSFGKH